ncbi:unnamed protein product, partial [Closterium sp. NIES-53]
MRHVHACITCTHASLRQVPGEVVVLNALVDGEEDEVVVFRGFSSSLVLPTPSDPSDPVLPASAAISSVDRSLQDHHEQRGASGSLVRVASRPQNPRTGFAPGGSGMDGNRAAGNGPAGVNHGGSRRGRAAGGGGGAKSRENFRAASSDDVELHERRGGRPSDAPQGFSVANHGRNGRNHGGTSGHRGSQQDSWQTASWANTRSGHEGFHRASDADVVIAHRRTGASRNAGNGGHAGAAHSLPVATASGAHSAIFESNDYSGGSEEEDPCIRDPRSTCGSNGGGSDGGDYAGDGSNSGDYAGDGSNGGDYAGDGGNGGDYAGDGGNGGDYAGNGSNGGDYAGDGGNGGDYAGDGSGSGDYEEDPCSRDPRSTCGSNGGGSDGGDGSGNGNGGE